MMRGWTPPYIGHQKLILAAPTLLLPQPRLHAPAAAAPRPYDSDHVPNKLFVQRLIHLWPEPG